MHKHRGGTRLSALRVAWRIETPREGLLPAPEAHILTTDSHKTILPNSLPAPFDMTLEDGC